MKSGLWEYTHVNRAEVAKRIQEKYEELERQKVENMKKNEMLVCNECGEIVKKEKNVDFQTCLVCGNYLFDYRHFPKEIIKLKRDE